MEKREAFNIPIAKPSFSGGELELIEESLSNGWVSQGPLVKQFEELVAEYVCCDQAVAVTSCTTGLHLANLIHGIGPGDEVICPSFSFIATANGVIHSGASVQFCDIEEETMNLDPQAVRTFIEANYRSRASDLVNIKSGKTLKAIVLVHQIGIPADIDSFNEIAQEFGIFIIEDSACAIGSFYKGNPLGSSGNVGVLSFHPRKVITCGEGGMLLLKNADFAEKARVLRAHGASISDLVRHQSKNIVYEQYEQVGYNYRMTDIQAALGVKQMGYLPTILERRNSIAAKYNDAFGSSFWIKTLTPPAYVSQWNYQSYPLILDDSCKGSRERIMQELQEKGVSTRRGIPPIHKEPAYFDFNSLTLPVTESLSERVLFLPIFPTQTDHEVEHVIASVQSCERLIHSVAN